MASPHPSSDPLDDLHESYTTNFPHHLRTRGVSPYTPNRATTIGATPAIPRRPPIPEVTSVQYSRSLLTPSQDFRLTDPQSELIDTAIVIKNIPFGYPEEDFVSKLFPQLGLAPPYAFNYHRNRSDRAFHGLAFANFNAPHEAQAAVDTLNNFELSGRRLRVELKKRLPAEEEQRQRLARQSRRQLAQTASGTIGIQIQQMQQEGHGLPLPPVGGQEGVRFVGELLDPQLRPRIVFKEPSTPSPKAGIYCTPSLLMAEELDMNNSETLGFYTELQLFLNNHQLGEGATLQFPATLTSPQRRMVRALAEKLNLKHATHGIGPERFVTVSRTASPLPEHITELSVPSVSSPDLTRTTTTTMGQQYPTARSILSEDRLHLGETIRSPIAPTPRLRTVHSMGNLRQGNIPPPPDPSTMPPLPQHRHYDLLSQFDQFDPFARQGLVHRASQESAMSSTSSSRPYFYAQPARQPIGPPQGEARGFVERPSREAFGTIRPIGHGAKTPSHGSLSHGSSRESRGGSDQSVLELGIQGHHPSEY